MSGRIKVQRKRREGDMMSHELRWNPVLGQWVVIAPKRHVRPVLSQTCPFCPGSEEVRGTWTVRSLANRYPAFDESAPPVSEGDELYRKGRAIGRCEVLLETPVHDKDLADLSLENICELVRLYRQRYLELGKLPWVKYVFIFRNKGEVIGVTLTHPHGQLYALPFVPPVAAQKLSEAKRYMERTGRCLYCDVADRELDSDRLVSRNDSFLCFVPFAPRFAYETMILPVDHVASVADFDEKKVADFSSILRDILSRYNRLFGFSLPYVLCIYNAPTDGSRYPHHHLHVEIMPRHRSRDQIKYLAGSEVGAGVYINDSVPEERAAELRRL